jgi:hypothetical protein
MLKSNIGWIKAFEMNNVRQTVTVSWKAKKTNECVLNHAGVQRCLLETIKGRNYVVVLRTQNAKTRMSGKDVILDTMPGIRQRGRPRNFWRNNIKALNGLKMEAAAREHKT